jgi:hypothetical protein
MKQPTLIRRSTVLSLPPQLVFLDLDKAEFEMMVGWSSSKELYKVVLKSWTDETRQKKIENKESIS